MKIPYSFVSLIFLCVTLSLCSEKESIAKDKLEKLDETVTDYRLNSAIQRRVKDIVAEEVQLALSQLVCSYQ